MEELALRKENFFRVGKIFKLCFSFGRFYDTFPLVLAGNIIVHMKTQQPSYAKGKRKTKEKQNILEAI